LRIYISGPATGFPNGNQEAFEAAKTDLKAHGHDAVCPFDGEDPEKTAESLNVKYGDQYWKFLAKDILVISTVDTIVFLPGWEKSNGARLEAYAGLIKKVAFFEYAGKGEDLIPSPPAYVAGVCAAEWLEGPFKAFLESNVGLLDASQEKLIKSKEHSAA
jgi:hypothetical protein